MALINTERWDHGDSWGSAMQELFAVCEVLDAIGAVPDRVDYQRGPRQRDTLIELTDEDLNSLETVELATAIVDGDLTVKDLAVMARVLTRYVRLLDAAGMSY